MVKELSVLDLAPGASPIRLTVYSKSALEDIAKIKSSHLELMVTIK
jgi:large subunit ribosomal protein L4e